MTNMAEQRDDVGLDSALVMEWPELAAMAQRAGRATPGVKWEGQRLVVRRPVGKGVTLETVVMQPVSVQVDERAVETVDWCAATAHDAEFFAHAREDVRRLVRTAIELSGQRDQLLNTLLVASAGFEQVADGARNLQAAVDAVVQGIGGSCSDGNGSGVLDQRGAQTFARRTQAA